VPSIWTETVGLKHLPQSFLGAVQGRPLETPRQALNAINPPSTYSWPPTGPRPLLLLGPPRPTAS
jgi:hypothetical protein